MIVWLTNCRWRQEKQLQPQLFSFFFPKMFQQSRLRGFKGLLRHRQLRCCSPFLPLFQRVFILLLDKGINFQNPHQIYNPSHSQFLRRIFLTEVRPVYKANGSLLTTDCLSTKKYTVVGEREMKIDHRILHSTVKLKKEVGWLGLSKTP